MDQNQALANQIQNPFKIEQKETKKSLIKTVFQMDDRIEALQQAGRDLISFYTNLKPRIFLFDPLKLQVVKVIELEERLIIYLDQYFFTENLETLVINNYYEGTFIMNKNDKLLKNFGNFYTFGIKQKSLLTRSQSPLCTEDVKKKTTIKEFLFDGTHVKTAAVYALPQSMIKVFKNSILVYTYNTKRAFIFLSSNRTINFNVKLRCEPKFIYTLGSENIFIFGETQQKARHFSRLSNYFKLIRKLNNQSIFVYGQVKSQKLNLLKYPKEKQQQYQNNIQYLKEMNVSKESRQRDFVITKNNRFLCQAVEKQLYVLEFPII
ncbi:hypothetical protein pb186bvf_020302 [Paramecium bursaria]